MKKEVNYIIEENVAIAIAKITNRINDIDFREKYDLEDEEIKLIHEFNDFVEIKKEEGGVR